MSACFRLLKRFRTRYAADACPTVSRRWRAIDIVQLSLHWSSAASNFRPRTAHSKPHLGLSFAKSADRTTRVLWNWNSWIYVSSERGQKRRPSEIRATPFHSPRCPICAPRLKGQTEQLGRPNETISNEIDLFFKLKNYENVHWRTTMKLFPVKLNVLINLSFIIILTFFF